MPSSTKRERQKAGRQARLAQLEAAKKRKTRLRQAAIVAVVVVVVGGIYALISQTSSSKPAHHAAASAKAAPCPNPNGSSARRTSFKAPPPMCISASKTYTATVTTDAGTFAVALDARAAPKTVNDFVYLARYHFYDGLTFHRVIPGFVVQGGDPTGKGSGGPGYTVAGEVPKAGAYKVGSLAMAKTGSAPAGSAGSQFFVITGQQGVSLPPQYSLFGHVSSGMAVVNKISADGTSGGTPKVVHKMLKVTIAQS